MNAPQIVLEMCVGEGVSYAVWSSNSHLVWSITPLVFLAMLATLPPYWLAMLVHHFGLKSQQLQDGVTLNLVQTFMVYFL